MLCGWTAGGITDLTPPPFDVGSRVHEYGGGAYAARGDRVAFSHRPDGSVWLIEGSGPPRAVCTVDGLRFADFHLTPDTGHLLAVREDHRRGHEAPEAALVALPLDAPIDPALNAGKELVRGADFFSSPRTSDDGSRLAWIEWDHPDMPWDATRLHVAALARQPQGDLAVSGSRCIAGLECREALMQPLFAPDGALHVCSDRSGWWNLYRVPAEGAPQPICPMPCEIGQPPWIFGQRSYGFLPDGGIVASVIQEGRVHAMRLRSGRAEPLLVDAVAECPVVLTQEDGTCRLGWLSASPDRPAAMTTAPLDHLEQSRIVAASHDPGAAAMLSPEDIATPETIRFPVADGSLGHGLFYAPRNRRHTVPEGERPPLLVMAHGGPTAMASAALNLRVQWWTSRGIAVVDVNYRGSTGFGRASRRRLEGAWGVVDVDDCIAACTFLIESGRVDPRRIAIRGSSAGGFTVLAALTRSALFSAAACLYGIGDLRLLAQHTHKFESRYLDRLVGEWPRDAALYEARSPIHNLDALRCPVIFFHGLDDKVVPVAQTRSMAEALRARGIAARVHEFAGEAHGFRREETIRQVLELELAFYGSQFGFTPSLA